MSDLADHRTGVLDWVGVLLVCLCAVLAAPFEALLVPLYAGSVPIPVAIALAVASNVAFPLLSRNLIPTLLATGLPFLAWLVVMIGFGVFVRPEGDVILPGGSDQWVSYGVMLGGALAGMITVVTAAPPARSRTP